MDKLNKVFLHNQRIEKFQVKVDNSLDKFRKVHVKLQNEAIKQRIKNKNKPSFDAGLLSKFASSREQKHFLSSGLNRFFKNEDCENNNENNMKFIKKYSNFNKKIEFDGYKIDIHMVNNVMHKQKLENAGFPALSILTSCKKKDNICYMQMVDLHCVDNKACVAMIEKLEHSKCYIIKVDKKKNIITFIDANKNNNTIMPYMWNTPLYNDLPFFINLDVVCQWNACVCVIDDSNIIACINWGFQNNDKLIVPLAIDPVQNTNKAYIQHHQELLNQFL